MRVCVTTACAVTVFVSVLGSSPANARQGKEKNAEDENIVQACVTEQANKKQSDSVVLAYCNCADAEMSAGDTSVASWEKSQPKQMETCRTKAGWK
jgi:hypothetical protein